MSPLAAAAASGRQLGWLFAVVAVQLALAATATAAQEDSALGIPCVPAQGGTQLCKGAPPILRVASWDGVPLDADIVLPPPDVKAPYPLIVGLHGFGADKTAGLDQPQVPFELAAEGYAVLTYTARGLGGSCGVVATRTPDCQDGWIHLADARYEARDAQYLAGLLVDEGLALPRIGVTGTSYGGGTTMLLATLKDRVMLPDGRFVPWRSPAGVPMRVAAAAPRIGWSDLAYALVPTGHTLDFRAANDYGNGTGIVKLSYLTGLFGVGLPGYYAPPGADPEADIINWFAELEQGKPYDRDLLRYIKRLFRRYHSAYYLQDRLPRAERERPAPLLIYNGWTDDIMPPDEGIRYYNKIRERWPKAPIGLVFAAEFAHNRGSLVAEAELASAERLTLFDRYLKGERSAQPLQGSLLTTQGCADSPELGPFRAPTWHAQHPGEVRLHHKRPLQIDERAGSAITAQTTDPFGGGGSCRTIDELDDPVAATLIGHEAGPGGFTLVGSPTITARLTLSGRHPQIIGRLWDLAPDGTQSFVTHGIYRPRRHGRQTFQLHPQGWHFAPGHRAKLELLGQSSPYAQPSPGRFELELRRLHFELPVRQHPDGAQIHRYEPLPLSLARRR